jgi:hypothetical protein
VFGWKPEIGDPTIYGWITVAAYALGAICCWRASTRAPSRERRFWLILTVIMAFLCVNKQLDLQELLTGFARFEAREHGWYATRHRYQVAFNAVMTMASTLAAVTLLSRARRASWPVRGAIFGLVFLLTFVLVRASSMQKVDWFINLRLAGVRANHVMELGGIMLVTVFALAANGTRGKRRLA